MASLFTRKKTVPRVFGTLLITNPSFWPGMGKKKSKTGEKGTVENGFTRRNHMRKTVFTKQSKET